MVNRYILIVNFIIMIFLIIGVLSLMFLLPMLISVGGNGFFAGLFLILVPTGLYSSVMQLRNKDQNIMKNTFFDKLLLYSPFINVAIILGIIVLLYGLG